MSDIRAVFMGQLSVDVSGGSDCFRPKADFQMGKFFYLVNGIFKDFAIRAKIFMHFSETTSGGSLIM